MKDIKVYGHDHFGELVQMADGYVVYFEDHAAVVSALQEQVRALAAEVQAVRWASGRVYSAGYNHGHLNTADGMPYAEDSDLQLRGTEVLDEFTDPDHSGDAADAVIREIRAQAIEDFTDSDLCGQEACGQACAYAARIRSGEKP